MGRILLILCLSVLLLVMGYFLLVFLQGVFSSKKMFKENDVVFYKGKYWLLVSMYFPGGLDIDTSCMLMGMEDSTKVIDITYSELCLHGMLQQDYLEAKMKSEAFAEVYSNDSGLSDKYGKKKK